MADRISFDQLYPGAVLVIHLGRICLLRRGRKEKKRKEKKEKGGRDTQLGFGNDEVTGQTVSIESRSVVTLFGLCT